MISLQHISGLPITLTKRGLIFSSKLEHDPVEKRHYAGNEEFFMPHTRTLAIPKPLYYIYRNVRFPSHTQLFRKQGIRYDITVLQYGTIGPEAVRTIGHIHKRIGSTRPAELYQVLHGQGLFYLQHATKKEIILVRAEEGSYVHIPGVYGHITIQASRGTPLVIANIFTAKKHSSDYDFFRRTHGPALFPVWDKQKLTFKKNPRLSGYTAKKITAQKNNAPLYPFE